MTEFHPLCVQGCFEEGHLPQFPWNAAGVAPPYAAWRLRGSRGWRRPSLHFPTFDQRQAQVGA